MSANVQNYSNEAIWNFLRASVDSLVFSIAIRNRPESASPTVSLSLVPRMSSKASNRLVLQFSFYFVVLPG